MPGTICLQGGKEFGSSCRELDLDVLTETPMGPIVVLAGAAAPGSQYEKASRSAARYYGNLSGDPAVPAPDPRTELAGCLAALAQAELIVLPGGSPTELLRVLVALADGAVGEALRARHAAGATISGASAGAMVLCAQMWAADADRSIVAGLGLVPGLALPHHQPGSEGRAGTPTELPVWGLPECGGVIITAAGVTAAGAGSPVMAQHGQVIEVPRDTPMPLPRM